jgi:hypothetical protein
MTSLHFHEHGCKQVNRIDSARARGVQVMQSRSSVPPRCLNQTDEVERLFAMGHSSVVSYTEDDPLDNMSSTVHSAVTAASQEPAAATMPLRESVG